MLHVGWQRRAAGATLVTMFAATSCCATMMPSAPAAVESNQALAARAVRAQLEARPPMAATRAAVPRSKHIDISLGSAIAAAVPADAATHAVNANRATDRGKTVSSHYSIQTPMPSSPLALWRIARC